MRLLGFHAPLQVVIDLIISITILIIILVLITDQADRDNYEYYSVYFHTPLHDDDYCHNLKHLHPHHDIMIMIIIL